MKSVAELQAIKDRMKQQVDMRKEKEGYRVVVGMATCGIAAGARPVMEAMLSAAQRDKVENVTITQTGCIGICRLEPVVEVFDPEGQKVTYVKMTPEKAERVMKNHIKMGQVVTEYTIGYEENN